MFSLESVKDTTLFPKKQQVFVKRCIKGMTAREKILIWWFVYRNLLKYSGVASNSNFINEIKISTTPPQVASCSSGDPFETDRNVFFNLSVIALETEVNVAILIKTVNRHDTGTVLLAAFDFEKSFSENTTVLSTYLGRWFDHDGYIWTRWFRQPCIHKYWIFEQRSEISMKNGICLLYTSPSPRDA